MMSQPLHRFLSVPLPPPPSVFCLHTSDARHKSPQPFVFLLPRSLYSLFAAQEQSILFKETPERWKNLSTRTHTHTGIIIMDAHGLEERTRESEKEAERDGCLLSSGLPPLWLDRWMTSLCVCVSLRFFLPVSFFCPLYLTGGGGRKGRNGQRRSEAGNNKYWLIREVERKKWGEVEESTLKQSRRGEELHWFQQRTLLSSSYIHSFAVVSCIHLHVLPLASVIHPSTQRSCDPNPNLKPLTSPFCPCHHDAN